MAIEITRRDARRAALTGLIDYAGLFPPALLSLEDAVAEYRSVRAGDHAWLVRRFICPAERLVDLAQALSGTMTDGEPPWPVVVTASGGDASLVADFVFEMKGGASVDVVEIKAPADFDAIWVASVLDAFEAVVYFEVPWTADPQKAAEVLTEARRETGRLLGAKIRCGGVTSDAFPGSAEVAAALVAFRANSIPLKATAGLHHPFRHTDPETGFRHHGFLNLLAASALAGNHEVDLVEVLEAEDGITLDVSGLEWAGHRVSAESLQTLRNEFFSGYGSCSVDEPVEDLTGLGVLPVP